MTMHEARESIPAITNDTGISLKMVISIVIFAVFLTTTYLNLNQQQGEILQKIESIERSLSNSRTWTRANMEDFILDFRANNPEIKIPNPDDFIEADN